MGNEIITYYENEIEKIKTTDEMKKMVRKMFKDDEKLDDLDFTDLVYDNVIPRLEKIGVVFDRENEIDYEKVLKEEY